MSGARGFADRMPAKAPANRKPSSQTPVAGSTAKAGPQTGAMTQLASALNGAPAVRRLEQTARTLPRKGPRHAGLPAQLKSGIEALSGLSMDHVRVHYNSARPAAIQAHAFARGADIHLGPGQERHLPHEAWHVVQQAQGRVRPTTQAAADRATTIPVNDDPALESEADRMGARALSQANMSETAQRVTKQITNVSGPTATSGVATQMSKGKPRGTKKSKTAKHSHKSYSSAYSDNFTPSDTNLPSRSERGSDDYLKLIQFQNDALRDIKSLYIDSSNEPEFAYTKTGKTAINKIDVDSRTTYPRDTTLVNSFFAYFIGEFYKYKITLLQPVVRQFRRKNPINKKSIKNAMKPPFVITNIALRGEGSAMGRPIGGDQFWGINPNYDPNLGHIKSNNYTYLLRWGLNIAKFPSGKFHNNIFAPKDMIAIPPPRSQPFVFYIQNNVPMNGQRINITAPKAISAADFSMYKQNITLNGYKYYKQSTISQIPKTDRQTGHRDPGSIMGTQAWKLASGGFGGTARNLASHEWCHLIGDGDGGACAPENLVIGTNSVNTEQLAMETALRSWRPGLARVGRAIQIKARALAEENTVDRKKNKAVYIQYKLSLVDPNNNSISPIEIIKHQMDGQRGAIPKLEYDMLHAMVNERIKEIVKARGWKIP